MSEPRAATTSEQAAPGTTTPPATPPAAPPAAPPASAPTSPAAAEPPDSGSAGPRRREQPTFGTVAALLRKELLVELRTLESVPAMTLFAVTTFVIFHFALNRGSVEGDLAAGILWVTLLFAAILAVNRLFVADAEQGGFDGFLLAPVDRSAMLIAKVLTLLAYLVVLELVAVPAFALLLLAPPLGHALPALLVPLALGDAGVAVIGTLVAAMAVRTRTRDLLGPLLALPLFVPIVIGCARTTSPLLSSGHAGALPGRWLLTLALYDLLFGLITFALFDFLLED